MDLSIIKDLRKKQGLSQKNLANLLDVSPSYIQKIECNKKNPSISTLKKLSSALNIELSLLLDDTNNDTSSSFNSNIVLSNNIPLEELIQFDECIDKNISIADTLNDIYLLENLYKDKLNHLKEKYEQKFNLLEDENHKLRLSLTYLDTENKKLLDKIDSLTPSKDIKLRDFLTLYKDNEDEDDCVELAYE